MRNLYLKNNRGGGSTARESRWCCEFSTIDEEGRGVGGGGGTAVLKCFVVVGGTLAFHHGGSGMYCCCAGCGWAAFLKGEELAQNSTFHPAARERCRSYHMYCIN